MADVSQSVPVQQQATNALDYQVKRDMVTQIAALQQAIVAITPPQTGTKIVFSGSTDGEPIKIAATATPGTAIHTASATATDEIWLFVTNTSGTARQLTVEFGDATAPDHNIVVIAPATDTVLVIPGGVLTNSKTVKAFAAAANVLNVFGYVNRLVSV